MVRVSVEALCDSYYGSFMKRQIFRARLQDFQSAVTQKCSGKVITVKRCVMEKRGVLISTTSVSPRVLQVGHYTTVFLCLYGGGGKTLPAFIAASDKYS